MNTEQIQVKISIRMVYLSVWSIKMVIIFLKMNDLLLASWIAEIRHHRHWQRVIELVSGCKLSMLNFTLPDSGTSLGGSVSLHGNNLTLACYHGINFRSKSWALFTLAEPNICFATGAQDGVNAGEFICLSWNYLFKRQNYFVWSMKEKKI